MTYFSIIIPCFNAEKTLAKTLDAICAQTHSDWEALCIDDGSTDTTSEIIHKFAAKDARISAATTNGSGASRARNMAAHCWAVGDVLSFCDADDIWAVDKLAQLTVCFDDKDVDAAYGQVAFFQDDKSAPTTYSTVPDKPLDIPMLLAENPVCTMSNVSVRRQIFRKTGGFNDTMARNEDLEWLVRLVGEGAHVVGYNICQTYYRTSSQGLSSDLDAMLKARKAVLRTAKTYGHNPTPAANATYYRYLARRALRLGQGRTPALRYALRGLLHSPLGFFDTPRRGALTLAAAFCAMILPPPLTRAFFNR